MKMRTTWAARLLLLVGAASACSTPTDPSWLTGSWAFAEGAKVTICGAIPVDIKDTVVALRETSSGAELDLGCRCRLAISSDGALGAPDQSCKLLSGATGGTPYEIDGTVKSWRTTPGNSPDSFKVEASGTAIPIGLEGALPSCEFSITGDLVRTESQRPACGANETAVGVYSVAPQCPLGAGVDGLLIVMVNDASTGCAASSGYSGEPSHPPPDSVKSLPPCKPGGSRDTQLHFCRVDGQLFKPLPADAGSASTYAVLKLGDECPTGGVEVSKWINNDDGTRENGFLGDIAPNVSSNMLPAGTYTELHFCLFPSAQDTDTPTLTAFPDFGFGYMVLHDFEGFQPPWVRNKHWRRSDDESAGTSNKYLMPDGSTEGAAIDLLKRMVEEPPETETGTNDTVFDFAVVR